MEWFKRGLVLQAKNGFAIELTNLISKSITIPVIASGGGGTIAHFEDIFEAGNADAALAASIFHYKEVAISDLKNELLLHKIPMRI